MRKPPGKPCPIHPAFARQVGTIARVCSELGHRSWAADRDSPFFLREGESISLLLVDQGVWSRIREDQGHLRLTIHVEGPTRGDRVVVTGEAAVLALLERQLTVDHLLNMQVLMIEEPPGKLFNGRLTITN